MAAISREGWSDIQDPPNKSRQERKGRPQNVYHSTKNLKTFLEKESSNAMVIID